MTTDEATDTGNVRGSTIGRGSDRVGCWAADGLVPDQRRLRARDRFVFGLFTEACGAEGCAQWAFQWPPGNTDPYEAAAAGDRTGYHYALPAPDGPLPTTAPAGVREGIDDARYLALLRARAPGGRAGALDDVPTVSVAVPEYLEAHDANSFDVRRWRMAQAILDSGK